MSSTPILTAEERQKHQQLQKREAELQQELSQLKQRYELLQVLCLQRKFGEITHNNTAVPIFQTLWVLDQKWPHKLTRQQKEKKAWRDVCNSITFHPGGYAWLLHAAETTTTTKDERKMKKKQN